MDKARWIWCVDYMEWQLVSSDTGTVIDYITLDGGV
jgi:hypothetical protein